MERYETPHGFPGSAVGHPRRGMMLDRIAWTARNVIIGTLEVIIWKWYGIIGTAHGPGWRVSAGQDRPDPGQLLTNRESR
jgi:hypothetical protein